MWDDHGQCSTISREFAGFTSNWRVRNVDSRRDGHGSIPKEVASFRVN